jgi:hypothetical protein
MTPSALPPMCVEHTDRLSWDLKSKIQIKFRLDISWLWSACIFLSMPSLVLPPECIIIWVQISCVCRWDLRPLLGG